jgi:hypothetical protein
MKTYLAHVFLAFCIVAGGTAAKGQRLYPVQGPAAAQTQPAAFTAKLPLGKARKITLIQANGESFAGTWKIVTASTANAKPPGDPASFPPQPNLAFAWDAVYGPGYYVANILGSQTLGQGVATGNQGTVLQIEFRQERLYLVPVDNSFGVAVDNKGNIYKVVL